jgi:CRISPR/Cas system CSM-associated protein Csm3 (group 7 of RAMP superfamily)
MKKVIPFTNRWLIRGTLITLTELHIGDGGAGEVHDRSLSAKKSFSGKDDESDASSVSVDANERAYLPASAIKGALRARLKSTGEWCQRGADGLLTKRARMWECLLGSDTLDENDSVGGKLVFFDASWESGTDQATLTKEKRHLDTDRDRPWWDNKRKTCVVVSVSLDRRTRTAKNQKLYHLEYVPAQETFRFEIGADDLDLENHEIKAVLGLLESFNHPSDPVSLGGQTSNGWGRMKWTCESANCFDDLKAWLESDDPPLSFDACTALGSNRLGALVATALPTPTDQLIINLTLTLESPWLIRDPRQRERSEKAKELVDQRRLDESDKPTDAVPVRDESGKPFVPAKSLRGALRSRAEMILRTLGHTLEAHPSDINPISTKDKDTQQAINAIAQKDLAARLFGLSGWLAPLHIPRLTQEEPPPDLHQEFVAIDRFTGGGADGAKFDACLAGMTVLQGTLTLDLDRLRKVDGDLASLGLLALVLRDLKEGDIPIGSGSAKGQGFCKAEAEITENGTRHSRLTEWFQKSDLLKNALHDPSSKPMSTSEAANT